MLYNIKWVEKKNNSWIVASLIEGAVQGNKPAEYTEVSINRVNKKGEVFPNFDEIQAGRDVEGEIWQSSGGKWYLFAPRAEKPATGRSGAFKSQQITQAQDRKAQDIGKTLDRKEESIKLASAQRDAVLIVNTILQQSTSTGEFGKDEEIKTEIIKWRNWFLSSDFTDAPPF